jgi:hypothetical protein
LVVLLDVLDPDSFCPELNYPHIGAIIALALIFPAKSAIDNFGNEPPTSFRSTLTA